MVKGHVALSSRPIQSNRKELPHAHICCMQYNLALSIHTGYSCSWLPCVRQGLSNRSFPFYHNIWTTLPVRVSDQPEHLPKPVDVLARTTVVYLLLIFSSKSGRSGLTNCLPSCLTLSSLLNSCKFSQSVPCTTWANGCAGLSKRSVFSPHAEASGCAGKQESSTYCKPLCSLGLRSVLA